MKKCKVLAALLLCAAVLSGCADLLDRQYSVVEPHSQKYWESGDGGVLRAEDYQELVNGILTLVASHREMGTIRIYMPENSDMETDALLESACLEVQTETPAGAFAVDYLSYTVTEAPAYREVLLTIGYRRTAEQYAAVIHVTSSAAIGDMVRAALEEGRTELALRISYLPESNEEIIALLQVLEEECAAETGNWTVEFYPAEGENRIVEIHL